jgi:hypothetical protein
MREICKNSGSLAPLIIIFYIRFKVSYICALCVFVLVLFVLCYCYGDIFRLYTHIIRKSRTVGIPGSPNIPVNPFIRGSTVYRGADKSLARPGRKQATATEDFEFHVSYL